MPPAIVVLSAEAPLCIFPNLFKEQGHLLVFESTYAGFSNALECHRSRLPVDSTVFQLQVRYSKSFSDPLSYAEAGSTEEVWGTFATTETMVVVPFNAANCKKCADLCLARLLKPHLYTGLSLVQDYLLSFKDESWVRIQAARTRFGIPKDVASGELQRLSWGNEPMHAENIPQLLLNGPYPVSRKALEDAMKCYISKGNLEGIYLAPSCIGYEFTDTGGGNYTSTGVYNNQGYLSVLPYGMTHEDVCSRYPGAHVERIHGVGIWIYVPECPLVQWTIRWNHPDFATPVAYMQHWAGLHLYTLAVKLQATQKERKYALARRKYMYDVCIQRHTHEHKRMLLDETEAERDRTIFRDYRVAPEHILCATIGELNVENLSNEPEQLPECARDIWAPLG